MRATYDAISLLCDVRLTRIFPDDDESRGGFLYRDGCKHLGADASRRVEATFPQIMNPRNDFARVRGTSWQRRRRLHPVA